MREWMLAPLVATLVAAPVAAGTTRAISLADAVRAASTGTAAATVAGLETRAAAARADQARGAWLPSLTGTGSLSNRTFNLEAQGISFPAIPGVPAFEKLVGPIDNVDARVRVSQTLFDGAALGRVRAAKLGVAVASAQAGAVAEAASQTAALAWLASARASARVAARAADLSLANDLLDLAAAQRHAGTAPEIDVTRARTQVATANAALVLARNASDRSRIDLARALGLDPSSDLAPSDTLSDAIVASDAPEAAADAPAFALGHRPELASERARHARANADRSAIALERLPRLEASADWGASGLHADDAIATRAYGVALTWPLLDGLRRDARLAEQRAIERESGVREKDLADQVVAEVRGALLDLDSGREQRAIADERMRLALAEVDQARERFVNGVAGNIEVLNAQSSLVRARDAVIDARFGVAAARVALARAAGAATTLR